MKRLALTVLLIASTPLAALRAGSELSADPLPEASWTFTPAIASAYLFRGVRLADESLQSAVDFAYGPLSLGVWGSVALDHGESGDADPEIDFYGAYTIPLRDHVEFVPGLQIYTYPDAERSNGFYRATFEPSLAFNVELQGIRFTPKCYYDLTLNGATFEGTVATALPLTALGTELQLWATAGTFRATDVAPGTSVGVKNWGDYWSVTASIPYQVSARGKVALTVTYAEGRNNYFKAGTEPRERNDAAGGHAAVTLSYSFSR